MIWAEARDGAIGRSGVMPWHLPEDLAHFKRVTLGAPVVMGRRTWESLPERFRPLPGRQNVVVTRDPHYSADGAVVVDSLAAALERVSAAADPEPHVSHRAPVTAWIIGGGQLYREALPLANELVVTRIELDVPDADTFAPEFRSDPDWCLHDPGTPLTAVSGVEYRFECWLRS
jgi:dihydrofolate reductase